MEYKNNWPIYVQGKKSTVKATVESGLSDVCVGVKPEHPFAAFFVVYAAKTEVVKKKKMAMRPLTLDGILKQLIGFQSSKDLTFSYRARKASIELAKERSRLSTTKGRLMYEVRKGRLTIKEVEAEMRIENRKAISSFLSRWENLFEVVR